MTKSPTWTVVLPPTKLVILVLLSGSRRPPTWGLLRRENSMVAAYLSEARSSWMPLNRGFEKVMGVSVVLI